MKKLLYPLLAVALLSCHSKSKEPVKQKSEAELRSEYLQKALKSDTYKDAYMNVQRVRDSLALLKKGPIDTNAVIYEYNTMVATPATQVKYLSQVIKEMKKDTAYLKSVQLKVAADSAMKDKQNIKF